MSDMTTDADLIAEARQLMLVAESSYDADVLMRLADALERARETLWNIASINCQDGCDLVALTYLEPGRFNYKHETPIIPRADAGQPE